MDTLTNRKRMHGRSVTIKKLIYTHAKDTTRKREESGGVTKENYAE